MKRCIFLVTLVFLLGMANPASAETLYRAGTGQVSDPPTIWDWDAEVSSAWADGNNWVAFIWPGPPMGAAQPILPTSADTVHLNRGGAYPVLIDAGTSAAADILNVGFWDSLDAHLDVTGGTLDVVSRLSVGTADNAVHGYMNVLGGAITVGGPLVVGGEDWGAGGHGYLTVSGGTVDVGGYLEIGLNAGTGAMTLSGGTVTALGLAMAANGSLLIEGHGMLVLRGHREGVIDDYISYGWLSPCIAKFHRSGPYKGWTTAVAGQLEVAVDIKPQSCPNPLNSAIQGVTPVAVLGSAEFDVTTIDIASIRLQGVAPIRSELEDVAAATDGAMCDCTEEGPDGYLDLILKFETEDIVDALGQFANGETAVLILTGVLSDDTSIAGTDCIRIKKRRAKRPKKVK